MRTPRLLALLAAILVMATGCRFTGELDIKSADEINLSMTIAITKSELGGMPITGEDLCASARTSAQSGVTVTTIDDSKEVGCTVSASGDYRSMNTAATGTGLILEDGIWTIELPLGDLADSMGSMSDLSEYGAELDFSFKVTFPGKALTASAGGVISGNTVTWSDSDALMSGEDLQATGEDAGSASSNMVLIIVIVAVVVAGGVAAALIMRNRNKQKAESAAAAGAYPGYPQGTYPPQSGYYDPSQADPAAPQPADPAQGYQPPVAPQPANPTQGYQPPVAAQPADPAQGYQPPVAPQPADPGQQPYATPEALQYPTMPAPMTPQSAPPMPIQPPAEPNQQPPAQPPAPQTNTEGMPTQPPQFLPPQPGTQPPYPPQNQ